MAFTQEGSSNVGGNATWRTDDVNGDEVPASGSAAIDVGRGLGSNWAPGSTAAAPVLGRALVNSLLPPGYIMIQKTSGTERNTFTARVSLAGTWVQPCTINGTQVLGTIPAGALNVAGRVLRFRAHGNLGTTGTPNYTFDCGLGAGILATTGVLAMTAATSPAPWVWQVEARVDTTGATGTLITSGTFTYSTSGRGVTITFMLGNTVAGTGLTADLTAALAFSYNITSGTSDVANRCISSGATLEIIG